MMFHAISGLGQEDDDGIALDSGDYSALALPGATDAGPSPGSGAVFVTSQSDSSSTGFSSGSPVSGSPSTGFNWGIFGSLFGVAAADTAKVLTSSNTTAQVQAQSAAQIAASQAAAASSSASSSTMLYLGIAAVAGVLLVSVMKKGH